MPTQSPGKFITFEGGEGAGKTTLINSLEKTLLQRGYKVVKTREPGGSPLGEHIRNWLLNRDFTLNIGSKSELLLFLAARAQHLEEVIIPALEAGKIVLCDRFNDSTIAYQGVARGLGAQYVEHLCDLVCDGIIPHLTFILDVNPQEGLKRTKYAVKEHALSGEVDRIESEKLEFHQLVRNGMLQLAKNNPQRITVIDASKTRDAVFSKALERLESLLTECQGKIDAF